MEDKDYIKQQYINASSVAIPSIHPSLSLSSPSFHLNHQPIPIANILDIINRKLNTNDITNNNTTVLDGFYILDYTKLGHPTNVIKLSLVDKGLCTIIEDDLRFFTKLTYLDLSENNIDIIPLRCLVSLQELRLTCCNISIIPYGQLSLHGGFMNLNILDLSYNCLSIESISYLADLPLLRVLDLSGNELTTIPSNLNEFMKLEKLILDHNKISDNHIFSILALIPKINYISLAYNYLSKIDKDYCGIHKYEYIQVLNLSFNYFSFEKDIQYILQQKHIQQIIIYGNPILGPTGEDVLQIYIEDLLEIAWQPSKLGRQHPVHIITDIPRAKPKKGNHLGRLDIYKDFQMTHMIEPDENYKSNRDWREEGNKTIFAEIMEFIQSNEIKDIDSITNEVTSTFFITETNTKPISISSLTNANHIALENESNVMDDNTTNDSMMKVTLLTNTIVNKMTQAFNLENDKELEELEKITKIYTHKDEMDNVMVNEEEHEDKKLMNSSSSYTSHKDDNTTSHMNTLTKNSAIAELKFMIQHPLSNFYHIPIKGILPNCNYIQPNVNYSNRKVKKYQLPINSSSSIGPPKLMISTGGNTSKSFHIKSGNISSKLIDQKNQLKYKSKNMHKPMSKSMIHQVEMSLDHLHENSIDMKPLGIGINTQVSIEDLKQFMEPKTRSLKENQNKILLKSNVSKILNDL